MSIQVFHLTAKRQEDFLPRVTRDVARSTWLDHTGVAPQYYRYVAEVKGDDLELAFEKTNNIDHSWAANPEVTVAVGLTRLRSTSVGDVAISAGQLWLCESVGWTPILP